MIAHGTRLTRTGRGQESSSPAELVAVNVGRLRAQLGYSLAHLSETSGLSVHVLETIERGRAEASVKELWSLAKALHVPFSTLLSGSATPGHGGASVRKTRARRASPAEVAPTATSASPRLRRLQEISIPPHSSHIERARTAGSVDDVLLTSGGLRVETAHERYELAKGESIVLASDVERTYVNLRDEVATLYIMRTSVEPAR